MRRLMGGFLVATLIWVMAVGEVGKVVLWERHPDHPAGEVFLAGGDPPMLVAQTPEVSARLSDGRLTQDLSEDTVIAPNGTAFAPAPTDQQPVQDGTPIVGEKPITPVVEPEPTATPASTPAPARKPRR